MTDAALMQLQERIIALEERLALYEINGLADSFSGSGQWVFGSGKLRLDKTGIQIKAGTQLIGIAFVPAFRLSQAALAAGDGTLFGSSLDGKVFQILTQQASPAAAAMIDFAVTGTDVTADIIAQSPVSPFMYPKIGMYASATENYIGIFNAGSGSLTQFLLPKDAADPTTTLNAGGIWYRSDLFRPRIRSNGITGNLGIEIQSATAPAIATNGTIVTAGVSVARVAPAGAVTGVILAVGTTGGQVCTVINESAAASTVTFAAAGTSNVADGAASVIAGLNARRFVWNSVTSLWYPTK